MVGTEERFARDDEIDETIDESPEAHEAAMSPLQEMAAVRAEGDAEEKGEKPVAGLEFAETGQFWVSAASEVCKDDSGATKMGLCSQGAGRIKPGETLLM
jgi:hypothetical protein